MLPFMSYFLLVGLRGGKKKPLRAMNQWKPLSRWFITLNGLTSVTFHSNGIDCITLFCVLARIF
jgi:hypothetical protein